MKKRLFIYIIIITLMFISNYTVVKAKSNYLYDVLKDEAESGGLAREYTGEHHDSFTEEPSKKIYHWYAESNDEGNQVLEKNNVIFANHCWQMIRTTDTGGVKIIYNGEAVDNQCLSTRGTHVGYASRTSQNLASNYWYGTDYTYDSSAKKFKVSGTTEQNMWNESNGPGLVGKYTCKLTSEDGTCATLYLVESYYNTTSAYVIPLNSNSNYSQFGTLQFNVRDNSPTYVGYMYGDVYAYSTTNATTSQSFTTTQTMLQSTSLGTSYWYADTIDYGTLTANRYSLVNPYQVSGTTDYPNLVEKYTFISSSQTNTATNVYYIAAVNNTTMYYKQLQSGNLLSAYEPIVFGDSITDNGDGTYTINNPTNVTLSDWYTNYANYKNKYTCNDSSTICASPRYTTATTSTNYTYINAGEKIIIGKTRSGLTLTDTLLVRKDELVINSSNYSDYKYTCNTDSATCTEATLRMISGYSTTGYNYAPNHYYGSSITWDGTNYTLVDPIEIENYNNMNNISTHHYMCVSNGLKTCATVAYVYYYTGTGTMYYITLKDGVTTVDKALEDMLTKNTTNSTMKSGVDAWYKHYLLEDYDDYIEDTIFCNDRSIRALNGWNPDGGMTNEFLQFKEYEGTSDLSCTNTTDQFSISNNNAKLTYKVGLMSSPEMKILNNNSARKTGQSYWLASPGCFSNDRASVRDVVTNGSMYIGSVNSAYVVRPAVSLKSSARAISGDGSTKNPYKLSFNPVYSVSTEIKNETKNLDISIEDMTQVEEGEKVTFKITPIDGYKLSDIKILDSDNNEVIFIETSNDNEYSFIMPPSNVTIKPTYKKVSNSVNIEDNKNTKEFIIEVNDSKAVVYEDTVKFTIIPEEGYEIEDIEIIDKNNNKIEYKKTSKDNEYLFTMPETDVLIKPIYKKLPIKENNNIIVNPLTNNKFIRLLLLIMLFFSIGIFLYRKKGLSMNT